MAMPVILGYESAELAAGPRYRKPVRHVMQQLDTAAFVSGMAGKIRLPCRGLAEIMYQRRKPDIDIVAELCCLLKHHQRMQTAIDLGMPLRRLRHAEQCVDLRKDDGQCAAVTQCLKIELWIRT